MCQVLWAADLHLFCSIDPVVTNREKQHLGHAVKELEQEEQEEREVEEEQEGVESPTLSIPKVKPNLSINQ